jgi:hypothetical protein
MLALLICKANSSGIHLCPDSADGSFFRLHCRTGGAIENKPHGYTPAPVHRYVHAPSYYAEPAVGIGVVWAVML